jgi:hypothetical protein
MVELVMLQFTPEEREVRFSVPEAAGLLGGADMVCSP